MDHKEHVKNVCNAAHEFVDNGWNIFPISYNTRLPLAEWKIYQTEHTTHDDIDSWEDKGAPYQNRNETGFTAPFNIALATGKVSGLLVVDCDSPEAVAYATANGLASPISVKTSRGQHFYFRHPGTGEFRNKVGSNPGANWPAVPGLDFRGDGGYVVAPSSVKEFPDGTTHTYKLIIPPGCSLDDMPLWSAPPETMAPDDMTLLSLDLSTINIKEHISLDVEEQVKMRTAHLGRKLRGPDCGDGTDTWMIKFCGQKVRQGVTGDDLKKEVVRFLDEHFEWVGNERDLKQWLITKMRSALDMDRRNHPTDYNTDGTRKGSEEKTPPTEPKSLKPIYVSDIDRILAELGDVEYWADPLFPAQSIIQVIGYNGHGKSYFLSSILMSMCAGQRRFGPYDFNKSPPKVLYMDFDNPGRTVLSRMKKFSKQFGDPADKFALWSAAAIHPDDGGSINLNSPEGTAMFERWVDYVKPDIIVIDTIRNAFGGFDENSAQEWHRVNSIAKYLRDTKKATVILVHHRNKPGESGLGREAGSTAQLTNIDTQIIVTQVYTDKDVAKKKAGTWAGDCDILAPDVLGGASHKVDVLLSELARKAHPSHRFKMISEISFGKVRQMTELHETHYIGYGENLADSSTFIESTRSLKQIARFLSTAGAKLPGGATTGMNASTISQKLMVPKMEIERWIK